MIKDKILAILNNKALSQSDKLIEIHSVVTNPKNEDSYEIPGLGTVTMTKGEGGDSIVIDGSKVSGVEWTDEPRLMEKNDIFYDCGCTWGTDLDGKRFWKLFDWYDKQNKKERGYNRYTDPVRKELYRFEEIYDFNEWFKRKIMKVMEGIEH